MDRRAIHAVLETTACTKPSSFPWKPCWCPLGPIHVIQEVYIRIFRLHLFMLRPTQRTTPSCIEFHFGLPSGLCDGPSMICVVHCILKGQHRSNLASSLMSDVINTRIFWFKVRRSFFMRHFHDAIFNPLPKHSMNDTLTHTHERTHMQLQQSLYLYTGLMGNGQVHAILY